MSCGKLNRTSQRQIRSLPMPSLFSITQSTLAHALVAAFVIRAAGMKLNIMLNRSLETLQEKQLIPAELVDIVQPDDERRPHPTATTNPLTATPQSLLKLPPKHRFLFPSPSHPNHQLRSPVSCSNPANPRCTSGGHSPSRKAQVTRRLASPLQAASPDSRCHRVSSLCVTSAHQWLWASPANPSTPLDTPSTCSFPERSLPMSSSPTLRFAFPSSSFVPPVDAVRRRRLLALVPVSDRTPGIRLQQLTAQRQAELVRLVAPTACARVGPGISQSRSRPALRPDRENGQLFRIHPGCTQLFTAA